MTLDEFTASGPVGAQDFAGYWRGMSSIYDLSHEMAESKWRAELDDFLRTVVSTANTRPVGIPADVVLTMVKKLMEFPYPTICRHAVGLDLLGALAKHGHPVSSELLDAVCCARDDEALELLS